MFWLTDLSIIILAVASMITSATIMSHINYHAGHTPRRWWWPWGKVVP